MRWHVCWFHSDEGVPHARRSCLGIADRRLLTHLLVLVFDLLNVSATQSIRGHADRRQNRAAARPEVGLARL
jgi:hypothetical protein